MSSTSISQETMEGEGKEKEATTVTLLSSEGEAFVVERKVAELSQTIKNLLEERDVRNLVGDGPIPLFLVNSEILIKVIDYCKKKTMDELGREWSVEHLKGDLNTVYDLLLASDYLHIQPLLDLAMNSLVSVINGKSPEELRQILNVQNDFTPEEEAEVRREYAWAFE